MKLYIKMFLLFAVVFSWSISIGLLTKKESKKPVPVAYFKAGQILLPDYACPDTLIVIDAVGLNKGMALIEQGFIDASDYQIDSILQTNCTIK